MKLSTLAILMLCITLTIVIFDNTGTIDTTSGEINFYNSSQDVNYETGEGLGGITITTRIWDFFKDPSDWSGGGGWIFYLVITLAASLTAFIAAALLRGAYAPDTYVFALWFGSLIGFGAIPVSVLFNFIQNRLSPLMCGADGGFCLFPTVIAILIAGSLGFTWVTKCINSWRTGQE